MLEVTEQHGQMRNICMGCKQDGACQNAMAENFWDFLPANVAAARYARPDPYDRFTKCKPEDSYNQIDRSYCRYFFESDELVPMYEKFPYFLFLILKNSKF